MRPEVRPRKLTRRSASPSAKVLRMMASVSRAGMKCRRDRLERFVLKDSGQAGRTSRTRLNTTGEEASKCWCGGVVEEMAGDGGPGRASNAILKAGKPSSITFNVGAPTFWEVWPCWSSGRECLRASGWVRAGSCRYGGTLTPEGLT